MPHNDNNTENEQGIVSKALKILAFPASAAAGIFYGNSRVRDQNYNNLKSSPDFQEMIEEANVKRKAIKPPLGEAKDVSNEMRQINKELADRIDKRIADIGLGTFRKKVGNLHGNQITETVVGAITVTTLVLGAMLAIADHKTIANLFCDKSKDNGVQ